MAACPNCHQAVEILDQHLGTLFTCPHCNAVFFVDWNGQPEMASHESDPVDFQGGADFQAGTQFEAPPQQDFNAYGEVPSFETPVEPDYVGEIPQNIPEEMTPQEEPYLSPAEEILPGSEIETPQNYQQESERPSEEIPVAEDAYDFSQSLDQQPPQPQSVRTSDTADFADVTDFANTNAPVGPLSYVVIIDGIESSHLVKQLREAMTDSRFGWDVSAILTGMAGGRLILNGLSPAKASVLINRIKYLPFKISWRQDVLSGS